MSTKEQLIKQIMYIRERMTPGKGAGLRDVDVFEEHVQKSIKRIEQNRYLAKKFNEEELKHILQTYEEVRQS